MQSSIGAFLVLGAVAFCSLAEASTAHASHDDHVLAPESYRNRSESPLQLIASQAPWQSEILQTRELATQAPKVGERAAKEPAQLQSQSSRPLCPDHLLKGVSLSTLKWTGAVEFALNRTLCMGGNAAMLRITCSQHSINSLNPSCPPLPAEAGSELSDLLERGRCMGITFALQTELHSADEGSYSASLQRGVWAADIGSGALAQPSFTADDWSTWFAAWEAAERPWAAWSARHGIRVYSLGAELTNAQIQRKRFAQLGNATRVAYPATAGQLSYAYDKGSVEEGPVCPELDLIGVDPYYGGLGPESHSFCWRGWLGVGTGVVIGLLVGTAVSEVLVLGTWPRVMACVLCASAFGALLSLIMGAYVQGPSTEDLQRAWANRTEPLWRAARKAGKPVLVHEIGFRSLRDTNLSPGAWQMTGPEDDVLQEQLWATMLSEFCGKHDASEFRVSSSPLCIHSPDACTLSSSICPQGRRSVFQALSLAP